MIITYLRSSSYGCHDMCPMKYFLEYNLGWRGPSNIKAEKGTVVHKVLEILAIIKLKQQEIDLKAMETQAKLQKDMVVEGEKLDIERDRLEADTSINLMKAAADVSKEDSEEAMTLFKENMINSRDAMKQRSTERIARENAKSKTNGTAKK